MDDCLEWPGSVDKAGYGKLGRAQVRAHRLIWEAAHGTIPDGLFVCHYCDNPSCIRLAHLWLGTALDNNRDRMNKGRGKGGAKRGKPNLGRRKYDRAKAAEMRSAGMTYKQIAVFFGVNACGVHKALQKITAARETTPGRRLVTLGVKRLGSLPASRRAYMARITE